MKIRAGCQLWHKKPVSEPIKTSIKPATSHRGCRSNSASPSQKPQPQSGRFPTKAHPCCPEKLNTFTRIRIHNTLKSLGKRSNGGGINKVACTCDKHQHARHADLHHQSRQPVQVFFVVDETHDRKHNSAPQDPPQLKAMFHNAFGESVTSPSSFFWSSSCETRYLAASSAKASGTTTPHTMPIPPPKGVGFVHFPGCGKIEQPNPRRYRPSPP